MNVTLPRKDLRNAAWVTITTPLQHDELTRYCRRIERLYRVNPYLTITSWRQVAANSFQVEWENHSTRPAQKGTAQFSRHDNGNEIQLRYAGGIKDSTYFVIQPCIQGSQLTIIDDYGQSDDRVSQSVDRSLSAWANSLTRFFRAYRFIQKFPLAERIVDRFWLPLNPAGKRIVTILFMIAAIETVLLLLFVALMVFL